MKPLLLITFAFGAFGLSLEPVFGALASEEEGRPVSGFGMTRDEALFSAYDQCQNRKVEFVRFSSNRYGHTATIMCGSDPEIYEKRVPFYFEGEDPVTLYYSAIRSCEDWKREMAYGKEQRMAVTPQGSMDQGKSLGYVVLCTLKALYQ